MILTRIGNVTYKIIVNLTFGGIKLINIWYYFSKETSQITL